MADTLSSCVPPVVGAVDGQTDSELSTSEGPKPLAACLTRPFSPCKHLCECVLHVFDPPRPVSNTSEGVPNTPRLVFGPSASLSHASVIVADTPVGVSNATEGVTNTYEGVSSPLTACPAPR